MIKVGIIGYGTIGKDVTTAIRKGRAGKTELKTILVRNMEKVQKCADKDIQSLLTDEVEAFFQADLDLIIETAGHEAVRLYGEKSLRSGSDFMVVSVGAFCDNELLEKMKNAASETRKQVLIPSAAIAGLDRIVAGAQGELAKVKLTSRKPPKAWYGTIAEQRVDLDKVTEPVRIFDGTARDSARLFPESVNVSAALSLSGVGFEETKVEVYVDPTITHNTHEISAKGHFGEVTIQVRNTPSATNPKTGYIVAMSVIKVLRNLSEPFVIGI